MKLQSEIRQQLDPRTPGQMQPFGGVLVLFKITIATTIVVGLFEAVSQPFGWRGVAQVLLCACLGRLLWLADAKLAADDSPAV